MSGSKQRFHFRGVVAGYAGIAMDESPSDAALWLEAVSGTEASFGVIYDRYRRLVFRKAYGRVQDVHDAEDIVAMVFLEAWRKRSDVRFVDGSLRPWLLVVTVNVTLNRERTNRRYRRLLSKLPAGEHAPDASTTVHDRIERHRSAADIQRAMAKLTAAEQRIVELCLVEELPLAAAAAALDIPVGTVKSRLHRARQRLRVELGATLSVGEVPS
jgi:RNA polymerase sigma factor (sigma-70 family)